MAIVESSDDAIIGESLDGCITSWNHAAERIFGYAAEEIIGKPISTLAWPGLEEDPMLVLERIRRGERVDHYETYRRGKNGEQLALSLTVSPICDASGKIVGVSKVARDLRRAREAERLRSLLAAIVESSDDAIISKDLNGIVTSWNRGAERILGYTAEEMIGRPITVIAPPGSESDMLQILERIKRGERVEHYETTRRRKDGREITVSLTVSPIRDASGVIIGASKVARDITGRKQAERALRNAEKLAVTGRMAASIAHEINNPLEALTNLLYLLDQEELGARAREYLSAAQHELARVSHITAQTLSFYRPSKEPAPANVPQVLDAALSLHQSKLASGNIAVRREYRPVPELTCNPIELRQVFVNLIGNALDSMSAGGELCVRCRTATECRSGRRGARVTVADTGHGMTREVCSRLFEPFYTTKGSIGTGLGLWITAEIVSKCGGTLSFRSSTHPDRHGSVFTVFLPAPREDGR